jgi:hypothetical protein
MQAVVSESAKMAGLWPAPMDPGLRRGDMHVDRAAIKARRRHPLPVTHVDRAVIDAHRCNLLPVTPAKAGVHVTRMDTGFHPGGGLCAFPETSA